MKGVAGLDSAFDDKMDFTKIFLTYPEYGYYAKLHNKDASQALLSQEQVAILNTDVTNYRTLLSPTNMRQFFYYFETEDYASIYSRFGL
jgi:hypothetical protein